MTIDHCLPVVKKLLPKEMCSPKIKNFILYKLIPAFEDLGYENGSETTEIFDEDGFFFLHRLESPFEVIVSVTTGDLIFCNLNLPFYQHSITDWLDLEQEEIKRRIDRTFGFHPILIPEAPEDFSIYIDRNFRFFQ